MTLLVAEVVEDDAPEGEAIVRVDHVMESRDVMNIHVVEHSILNGIEYCTFWFRSVVEMTRHQLLLQLPLPLFKQFISILGLKDS
jgi:hypothetical protein